MTRVSLTVYGRPAPKGSLRFLGNRRVIDANENLPPWREAIKAAALAQPVRGLDGPLTVALSVTVKPPQRPRNPEPITRASGDIDKHIRAVLDALQDAGVIVDDARVTTVTASKAYVGGSLDALDSPGAVITIWALT
jgi:Holliday junction resolvase RusA-like endonuclease